MILKETIINKSELTKRPLVTNNSRRNLKSVNIYQEYKYGHQVFKEKRQVPKKNFEIPKGASKKDKILENKKSKTNTEKYTKIINDARSSLKSRQEKLDVTGRPHSYFSPRTDNDFETPYSKLSDYVQGNHGKKQRNTFKSNNFWKYKDP